jgi:Ser/Thr protein kinase RdoA (MazF antagonist)
MEPGSAALLADAGLHPVRSRLVHERRTRVGRRALYRIDLADGRVKLRCNAKPERVAMAFRVRRQLEDPAFSRVLASSETLTLEEWIEGAPLEPDACDPATVREAARLLARLHAAPITGVPEHPPGGWLRRSVDALVRLEAGGLLPTHVLKRLRDRLARDEPATSRVGAVHSDFCAENMLRDTSAVLRVFDNEGVHFGALGFDLGRTWCRWPLPPDRWRLFLATYREALPGATPDGELDYWRTVAAVQAVAVRRNWSDGLEAALDRLRNLAS